jgi:hypothetical protein
MHCPCYVSGHLPEPGAGAPCTCTPTTTSTGKDAAGTSPFPSTGAPKFCWTSFYGIFLAAIILLIDSSLIRIC